MFNFYKLFVVFAALLSLAAARPSLVVVPSAVSHQSITQIHGPSHPLIVGAPYVTAVHPILTHPIYHHPHHYVIG